MDGGTIETRSPASVLKVRPMTLGVPMADAAPYLVEKVEPIPMAVPIALEAASSLAISASVRCSRTRYTSLASYPESDQCKPVNNLF